jgi:hypothetical protein
MKHPASHRLSAYVDGDLAPTQLRELEDHLRECGDCAELLADLESVRSRARGLPDRFPPRDLWPEIAWAIREDATEDPDVIRLHPVPTSGLERRRRGFGIPIPQAAAAGLALAIFSGTVGARLGRPSSLEPVQAPQAEASWVSLVGEASPGLEGSAREVARLEGILAGHRGELDPATARILEKNIGVIDQAIRESIAALRSDPGNRFLETHLEMSIQAKGEYLRDAAVLSGWIS